MAPAQASPRPAEDPADTVLPDVVEEHLAELDYHLAEMDRAFDHPLQTLEQLAEGIEEQAAAHLDALVVAGPAVARQLIEPRFEDPAAVEPAQVTAAAALALAHGRRDLHARLLSHGSGTVRQAAARGALWSTDPDLDRSLLARLGAASLPAAELAGVLEAVATRGLAPPPLLAWLQSDDPAIAAAATLALRRAPANVHLAVTEYLAQDHPSPEVRQRALLAALAWGSPSAWRLCARRALDPDQPDATAMTLFALLGDPAHHQQLLALRSKDSHRRAVIRALGHTGNTAIVPALLEHLESKDLDEARCAAQAVATITGLDLGDEAFAAPPQPPPEEGTLPPPGEDPEAIASLPPLEVEDLDADLVPPPETALPDPDARAIRRWWDQRTLPADKRMVSGQIFSAGSLLAVLATAPLGRRHALGLALGLRSNGRWWLETRAPSAVQRAELEAARALGAFPSNPFSRW